MTLLAAVALLSLTAHAAKIPQVALLGVLSPGAPGLGQRLNEELQEELGRKRGHAYGLIPEAADRSGIDAESLSLPRLLEAGRALGADKVVISKAAYTRVRAVEAKETTVTVSRDLTEWVDETTYEEVPNPQWEEWQESFTRKGAGVVGGLVCGGGLGGLFCGAAATSLADKLARPPKTLRRQIVRKVPKMRSVEQEVPGPVTDAKPGSVRVFVAALVIDVRTGKVVARDAVDYVEEIEPLWDGIESDEDVQRRTAKAAARALSLRLHEKLKRLR